MLDLDLREPASAQTVVSRTLDRFDRIDALLNIAGAVPQIDLFEMTDQQWDDGMALKLHGARRLTLSCMGCLEGGARGGRVDLGQFCGISRRRPTPLSARSTPRSSLWPRHFPIAGLKDGVQVNSVLPGPVMTGRRRSYLEQWAPLHKVGGGRSDARSFLLDAGIGRYGQPEEIAELMAFLVSPGARWMTGAALRMDGGEVKSIRDTP